LKWGLCENTIEVAPMEHDGDLLALFYAYYGRANRLDAQDEATVGRIINLVLGHTMTVMLIAAAMRAHGTSPADMLQKLQDSFDPGLENTVPVDKEEIPAKLRTQAMYQHMLNLFNMERFSDEQRELMTNMAVAPLVGLERDTFCERTYADEPELDELIRLRWVQLDTDAGAISLHPVISDVANTRLQPDSQKCFRMIDFFRELRQDFFDQPAGNTSKTYAEAKKAAQMMELACKRITDESGNTACLYTNFADLLEFIGDFDRNLEYCEKAVCCCEIALGEDDGYTIHMYLELAEAHRLLGDYGAMLPWLMKAFGASERNAEKEDWSIAEICLRIGSVYEWMEDYAQSFVWHKRALDTFENLPEQDEILLAQAYVSMGTARDGQRDYREALPWYEKALAIRERIYGEAHRHTILLYALIARASAHLDEDSVARQWLNQACTACEYVPDKSTDGMATVYQVIGSVYWQLKKHNEAFRWLKKAATTREKVLGSTHPHTIELYSTIACFYLDLGDAHTAMEWSQKIMAANGFDTEA